MIWMATVDSMLMRTTGSIPVAGLHQPYPDEDRASWRVFVVPAVLRSLKRPLRPGGVTELQPQRPKGDRGPWGVIKIAAVYHFLER